MRKRPIGCPANLGGCGAGCVEVGHVIGYPIPRQLPSSKGTRYIYRYACPECEKEWLHDTLYNGIKEIKDVCQFHFRIRKGKERIIPKDPEAAVKWGLPPGIEILFDYA